MCLAVSEFLPIFELKEEQVGIMHRVGAEKISEGIHNDSCSSSMPNLVVKLDMLLEHLRAVKAGIEALDKACQRIAQNCPEYTHRGVFS